MKTALYFCLNSQYLDQFKVLASTLMSVGQVPADVDWFVFSPDVDCVGIDFVEVVKTQCEYGTDIDGTPRQDCDDKLVGMRYLADIGYDQAVYLDCDMVVTADISELFNPLGDYDIAAVDEYFYPENYPEHPVYKDTIKINPDYFNSGVMVINLRSQLINAKPDKYDRSDDCLPKRPWRDQEWFNHIFSKGKIKKLSRAYNWKPETITPLFGEQLDHHMATLSVAKIVHFMGKSKPWYKDNMMSFSFERQQVPYWLYKKAASTCKLDLSPDFINTIANSV